MVKFKFILGIALFSWSCKNHKQNQQSLEDFVAQNCAQHPINFYISEQDHDVQVYYFGDKDEEFRGLLLQLRQRYHDQGTDISGSEKVKLVSQYLPNYIKTCKLFFRPVVSECGGFDMKSSKFTACIANYNRAYEEVLNENFQSSGPQAFNLESLTLNYKKKNH